MNTYDLSGRKAVVTGGAQGIGLAIVERFLASGAQVTIWDADRALGEQAVAALEGKGQVSCIDVDVSDHRVTRRQTGDRSVDPDIDGAKAGQAGKSHGALPG